jgi:uroporphyrinogen-III decarboxylase
MSEAPVQSPQDPTFDGWDKLDWQQRRDRRFQRWLRASNIQFATSVARDRYRERVQSLIDAILLKKPARVPASAIVGFFPTERAGLSLKEAMYEYDKSAAALTSYYDDVQPDFQSLMASPAPVFDRLGLQFIQWPGHGISENTPWQYLEGEYMKADEYDALIADPSDYFRRTYLPRIGSAFAPLAGLDRFANIMEASMLPVNILPFADPAVVAGVQRLHEAAQESLRYLMTVGSVNADAAARLGIAPIAAGMAKAPYDVLADTLRGTKGIILDRFRQPEKIIEAAERLTPLMVDWVVSQAALADAPLVIYVLHKGADTFMSDADFRTFYWPTLKATMKGLIEQGIVPMMFAEGGYNKRLEAIADPDLPAGSVLWLFDQTDMASAKKALGGYACIGGNVPTSLLALGTPEAVRAYVTNLLDTCARDGGFYLQNGAVLDNAKTENVKAMIDAGREWEG